MQPTLPIQISQEKITEFCQRHHIRKLSLFGSVLRDDFRPDSDIDVLVEFQPGKHLVSQLLPCSKNYQNFLMGAWSIYERHKNSAAIFAIASWLKLWCNMSKIDDANSSQLN